MSNILLIRIDNHPVHGQVGVTQTKTLRANLTIMTDDTVAEDRIQQSLMSATAKSSSVGIRFFTIEKMATIISRATPRQKTFIACRTPEGIHRLVEADVTPEEVNVGNVHFSEGKHAMTEKVYVDGEDMDNLRYLVSEDIDVYAQDVSEDPKPAIE